VSKDIFEDGDPFADPHWQKPAKSKRSTRFIGCPVPWLVWALPRLNDGKYHLAVALYLYRRCCVAKSDTVTVPNSEVEELFDLSRWAKCRILAALEQAGILKRLENGRRVVKVQLCAWPEPPSR
jgi:hypothetical protein